MAVTSPRTDHLDHSPGNVPVDWYDEVEHRRMLAQGVNDLFDGKIRSASEVTLAVSAATTTVQDRRVGTASRIFLMATTANAGGEVGVWISAVGTETGSPPIASFVINHGTDTRADRTFWYVVLG